MWEVGGGGWALECVWGWKERIISSHMLGDDIEVIRVFRQFSVSLLLIPFSIGTLTPQDQLNKGLMT